ncbi:unnamed protein product [Rhizopus stolonifer]
MKSSLNTICLLFILSQCAQVVHSTTSVTKCDTKIPRADLLLRNDRRALPNTNSPTGNNFQPNNVNSFNVGAAATTSASESSEAPSITQDPTTATSNPPSTTSTSNAIPVSTTPTETISSQSPTTITDSTTETTSTTSTTDAETTSSNTSHGTSTDARSTTSSSSSESTATPSSNPFIQNSMSGANTSRTGSIAGGVVGGVVGVFLIGGLIAFFTRRSKKQKNKENDYTIDMNQNDINSAPLPPFERHEPSPPQPMYTAGPLPSEPNDYHEGYSSIGYNQGAYGQDEAFQSNGYGYYDYPQRYSKQQQDNQVYYNEPYVQPISPIIGTLTESSYTSLTNKPNLKEKNKPDEVS